MHTFSGCLYSSPHGIRGQCHVEPPRQRPQSRTRPLPLQRVHCFPVPAKLVTWSRGEAQANQTRPTPTWFDLHRLIFRCALRKRISPFRNVLLRPCSGPAFGLVPITPENTRCGLLRKELLRTVLPREKKDAIGERSRAVVDWERRERARARGRVGGAPDAEGHGGGAPSFICKRLF